MLAKIKEVYYIIRRLQKKGEGKVKTFFGEIYINEKDLEEEGIKYPIKVEYYKTTDEEKGEKNYGVEIIKKEYRIIEDRIQIEKLTKEEDKIEELLNLLKTNEVSTIGAKDIIEDIYETDK